MNLSKLNIKVNSYSFKNIWNANIQLSILVIDEPVKSIFMSLLHWNANPAGISVRLVYVMSNKESLGRLEKDPGGKKL